MEAGTIITVNRQYGSGGRAICEILSERLGVPLIDRQIVYLAAKQLGADHLSVEDMQALQYSDIQFRYGAFTASGINCGILMTEHIFEEQTRAIRELAKRGGIFLGRCADYVLRNAPRHYSFFICADRAFRQRRGAEFYGGMDYAALEKEDAKRAAYYKHYTGREWNDPLHYDMVIQTGRCGIEQAAETILQYVERKEQSAEGANES